MRRDGGRWGALGVAIGALASSCGGSAAKPATMMESASLCTGAWQAFTTPEPFDETSPLVYHDGTIYYSRFSTQSLLSQPATGGTPTVVAQGFMNELWAEADHLLFTAGNLGNQVFSLPFAGGTPTLILDGGAGRTAPGVALHHAFTATDFYWTEPSTTTTPDSPTAVWQQSRSGGMANQIATLTFMAPIGQEVVDAVGIAVSGSAVLVGDDFGSSDAVPFDGSTPRLLAAPVTSSADAASLAGIDESGVYWSVRSASTVGFEVIRSPADGSAAQSFWKPADADVTKIWSDGNGGWIAYGLEFFDDAIDHAVIWSVDTQGNATRLACSPGSESAFWIQVAGGVAPDAIYLSTINLDASTWEIDRIAR